MTKQEKDTVKIDHVSGVEGPSLYVNDHRVIGPKPWGGGTILKTWDVPRSELLSALNIKLEN